MECRPILFVVSLVLLAGAWQVRAAPAPEPRFKGIEPFRCEPGAVWMEACSRCRCEMDSHVVCAHRLCLDDELEAAVEAVEAAVEAAEAAEREGTVSDVQQRQFGFAAISRRHGIPRRR